MNIIISNTNGIPIYKQISNQIKEAIIKGELKPSEMLPSIRLLAAELRVSVITTTRAYSELESEGLIASMPGKGYFIKEMDISILRKTYQIKIKEELLEVLRRARTAGITIKEIITLINELENIGDKLE